MPAVDARSGNAEDLPFADDSFDVALAQLVVPFMSDPVAGLREMARVTRPAGRVAACAWDHGPDGGGPLTTFWRAVHDLDPSARSESERAGAGEGQLADLFRAAGLRVVEPSTLTVRVRFSTFPDWWEPFTLGVGPAGDYVASLEPAHRDALRDHCASVLPPPPFEVAASAWSVRGLV